jgi:hypothetical protein
MILPPSITTTPMNHLHHFLRDVNDYDLANKFVAFNHRLDPKQHVASLLVGGGTAYVLTVVANR